MKRRGQGKPSTNEGIHWWDGAAAIFNRRATETRKLSKNKFLKPRDEEEISMTEAKAWIKKYLIVDSVEYMFFLLIMRGMKAKRLISRPNQAMNQEFAETVMKTEVIRRKVNTIEAG